MTTPQQSQQQQPATDAALALAVAEVLITAVSVTAAMAALGTFLAGARLSRQAMSAALDIVMSHPPGQEGFFGPASAAMARTNLLRRAQFAVSAARRLTSDIRAAKSRGQSAPQALAAGIRRERRFYAQHLMAIWQRSRAGAQVDTEAMTHGLLLGWHTTRDARTSPECLAADGKNFYADHMPVIGYPGAVHPHCRCRAGVPFPGARVLASHGLPPARRYRRAA